jgi:hypothetical protein
MTDSANITRLPRRPADRTAAARAKRYRDRKRDAAKADNATPQPAEVTVKPDHGVTASVVPTAMRRGRDGVSPAVLVTALGIASVSAFFSITGMTHVFSGSFWAITAMGVGLECAKLASIAWLGCRHGAGPLRIVLITLVTVLMLLSAIGSFGFLAAANIGQVEAHRAAIDLHAADIEARTKIQGAALADINGRVSQIDGGIDATIRRGRAAAAMMLVDQQKRNRADLLLERDQAAKKLAAIEIEAARIKSDRAQLAADTGPIRFLGELLGIDADTLMKVFIAIIAMLLDPLACALLLAATRRAN